ncbi:MAG: hypothetical protein JW715_10285 [Sedimentisphaerales bacterium]|nr:hypothetical protein [Sedimentisphaerales bacterium]
MSIKRLFPAFLVFFIGCRFVSANQKVPIKPQPAIDSTAPANQSSISGVRQAVITENTSGRPEIAAVAAVPVNAGRVADNSQPDKQLEINKNALLRDPNEAIRITAANLLLKSQDPNARQILIDTLNLTDNTAARTAICKTLIQNRSSMETIVGIEDFIQPLLGVFSTDNVNEAALAAEATLIYPYDKIRQPLEKLVTDGEKPAKTRINAIKALSRPDMSAIIVLIKLVDDPKVKTEAEKALSSLGIPVGTSRAEREKIIDDLLNKGMETVFRDLLIKQEAQMRQIQVELESWQKTYIDLLNKTYNSYSDDEAKGRFLVEQLGNSKGVVKLWALEQVYQRSQGTNPNLPKEIGQVLLVLISDQNQKVRLKTAELLALMRTLNSASAILAQFRVETNEQVKGQLLDTLGWVCSYGLLPSPAFTISPEIRLQAINLAQAYLLDPDSNKSQIGARVMKRLIERNGLQPDLVLDKLNLFVTRYNRLKEEPNEPLRGSLLNVMAGLVADGSACKAQAVQLFEQAQCFQEALDSKTNSVREAAVDGLRNIDETRALSTLRKRGFYEDLSPNVRSKMLELARKLGGIEDLPFLVKKIGVNSESQPAWQAMVRIFNDSGANIINEWMEQLTGEQSKLTENQKIEFLKIAESKVAGERMTEVRKKLAGLLYTTKQFEQAAEYFDRLKTDAQNPEEKNLYLSRQLDACLRLPNLDKAAELLKNCLSRADMEPNDIVIRSIDSYLGSQSDISDVDALLKMLMGIDVSSPKLNWKAQLALWADRFGKTEETEGQTQVN